MRAHFLLTLLLAVYAALAILLGPGAFCPAAESAVVDTSSLITASDPISIPISYAPRGALVPLAHMGGEIGALALDDRYAFIGQGSTVVSYEMRGDALSLIGQSRPLSGAVVQLELTSVDGRRLAVAMLDSWSLAILDLSDPAALVVLSTLPLPNSTRFVLGPRSAGEGLGFIYYFCYYGGGGFGAIDARDIMHPRTWDVCSATRSKIWPSLGRWGTSCLPTSTALVASLSSILLTRSGRSAEVVSRSKTCGMNPP